MSYEDPFNNAPVDAPAEEAQQPASESPWTPKVTVGSEGKVVLTYKGGKGYEAPWVVIHAADLDDALEQSKQFDKLKELFTNVSSGGKFFGDLGGPPATGGGGAPQSRAPQQAQQAPGGEQRFCPHGEMVFKSGVSKAGKAYQLFSCTAPRDQQCPAQFLR